MIDPDPKLPTAARDLLASLVGRRLLAVRRTGVDPAAQASLACDAGRGDLELELDGLRVSLVAEHERRSVLVAAGALAGAVDVAASAFWRWRLRRAVSGVRIWKSLDVPDNAGELEFGVELGLAGTRGVVVELLEEDGVVGLRIADGEGAERHRVLEVAGVVAPLGPGRGRPARRGVPGAGRDGSGHASRRRR